MDINEVCDDTISDQVRSLTRLVMSVDGSDVVPDGEVGVLEDYVDEWLLEAETLLTLSLTLAPVRDRERRRRAKILMTCSDRESRKRRRLVVEMRRSPGRMGDVRRLVRGLIYQGCSKFLLHGEGNGTVDLH